MGAVIVPFLVLRFPFETCKHHGSQKTFPRSVAKGSLFSSSDDADSHEPVQSAVVAQQEARLTMHVVCGCVAKTIRVGNFSAKRLQVYIHP